MKHITALYISIMAVFSLLLVPVVATTTVSAQTPKEQICKGINNSDSGSCNTSGSNNLQAFIRNIINILLFIIGSIAVIMVIIGGLRYVISGGDSSQTKSAKDTVLYAIIGLIVAAMSYALVNFIVLRV